MRTLLIGSNWYVWGLIKPREGLRFQPNSVLLFIGNAHVKKECQIATPNHPNLIIPNTCVVWKKQHGMNIGYRLMTSWEMGWSSTVWATRTQHVSLASWSPNENNYVICDLEDWKAFSAEKVWTSTVPLYWLYTMRWKDACCTVLLCCRPTHAAWKFKKHKCITLFM